MLFCYSAIFYFFIIVAIIIDKHYFLHTHTNIYFTDSFYFNLIYVKIFIEVCKTTHVLVVNLFNLYFHTRIQMCIYFWDLNLLKLLLVCNYVSGFLRFSSYADSLYKIIFHSALEPFGLSFNIR